MSEQIQFSAEEGKNEIYVFDQTGKYDKKCNPGGWGAPNLGLEDISKVELKVWIPESDEPIIVDVSEAFPNDSGIGFEILPEDLGLESIPSGIWKFEYSAYYHSGEDDEEVFSTTCYFFFDEAISCCVEKLGKSVDVSDTTSKKAKKFSELSTLLKNAKWAACCGDRVTAQSIAKYISLQCDCCL